MRRIKTEKIEDRTRDERETCFPSSSPKQETRGTGTR